MYFFGVKILKHESFRSLIEQSNLEIYSLIRVDRKRHHPDLKQAVQRATT